MVIRVVPRLCALRKIGQNYSRISMRYLSSETTESSEPTKQKPGFARAFEKFSDVDNLKEPVKQESFATLLRNSPLIDLGDPEGRIVIGTIFKVVDDDLYIDFGWKFHCVCPTPAKNSGAYVRGAKVKLKIKDLELSTRFLGSDKDLTILEAEATLIGLISTPVVK